MDVENFASLCKVYDKTIKNNPVLSRDEEVFIFNKINLYKNKIIRLCMNNQELVKLLQEYVIECLGKNKPYDFFVIPNTESTNIIEEMTNDLRSSLVVFNIDELLKKYQLEFQVFEKIMFFWDENKFGNNLDIYIQTCIDVKDYYINKICNSNIKLIIKIVAGYNTNNNLTVDDLFNEAFFGLHRVVNLFDVNRGTKFSTYAVTRIFATIRRYIDNHGDVVHIPVNIAEQRRQIEKIKNKFISNNERNPTRDELYELLKKKPRDSNTIDYEYTFSSIEASVEDEDGDKMNISNLLKDHRIVEPHDRITMKEVRRLLKSFIDSIEEYPEKYIITYSFGLNTDEIVLSKEEIISNLNISEKDFESYKRSSIKNLKTNIIRNGYLKESLEMSSGWMQE